MKNLPPNVHYFALSRPRQIFRASLTAWMCLLFSVSTYGNVWTWNGTTANGNWSTVANWLPFGTPANGDTVIFSSGSALKSTNNIANLTLGQILFTSGGFNIYGNPFTLTNSLVATNFTGSIAMSNSIAIATANVTMLVSNGVTVTFNGNISGSVGVVKTGLGTVTYNGSSDNAYSGTTLVSAGTLQLNVGGYNAFEGPLIIGDGSGTYASLVQNLQSEEIPETVPVTINLNAYLNLNNSTETIGTNLTMSGGAIQTGTGILNLSPNCTITLLGSGSVIYDRLGDGSGTLTIQGNGTLDVAASMSGTANIVQNGGGLVYWLGANTYSGNYAANGGNVYFGNSLALGNITNQMTASNNTTFFLDNNINLTNQSLTFDNAVSSGLMFSTAGSTNSWVSSFTNNTGMTIQENTSCGLTLNGPISGPGGLTYNGAGTLTLSGSTSNTYAGPTMVSSGTLLLDKPYAIIAVPTALTITNGGTVRLLNGFQIDSPSTSLTMGDNSLFDTAGFSEWVGAISLEGSQITSGGGLFYFTGDITVNASLAQSVISGNLVIWNGTHSITNSGHNYSPDLVISANISSVAAYGLVKSGTGEVSLAGNNTFTGPVTVNGGNLWAVTPTALGGSTNAPVTVNNGGTLYLDGSALNFGLKPLSLNGPGYFFGAVSCKGNATWPGSVNLNTDSTVYEFTNSGITFSGIISGPGSFIKSGPGTNTMAGTQANIYTGQTLVNQGVMNLSKSSGQAVGTNTLTIGDGLGNPSSVLVESFFDNQLNGINVVVNSDGLLNLNSHNDSAGPNVTLNDSSILNGAASTLTLLNGTMLNADGGGAVAGRLNVGSTSCVWSNTGGLQIFGTVQGSASIALTGIGSTYLYGSNSFTGPMVVQQGLLWLENSWALGTTNGSTVVSNGASLVLDGNIGVTNEPLTIYGPGHGGVGDYGSLDVESGTNIWYGPITNNGNCDLDSYDTGAKLYVNGPISGPGSLEMFNDGPGGGMILYQGSQANTYTGPTIVDAGCTLQLNKTVAYGGVPSNCVVSGTIQLGNGVQIDAGADMQINAGGVFNLGPYFQNLNTLDGAGNVTFGLGGYLNLGVLNGTSEFDGSLSGIGNPGGNTLNKFGTGTFTLGGTNSFTAGAVEVFGGKLVVNGYQPQAPVIVDASATLGGSGTVGTIVANGTISPGNSPGILTCSNVTFSATGKYAVELDGPYAGVGGYDVLNVMGTDTLANATLTLTSAFTTPVAVGQFFNIVQNNLPFSPLTGTFNGLPEGSIITVGNFTFLLTYDFFGFNYVILSLQSVPGTAVSSAVTAGDGSHSLDPNGCNNLSLVASNTTGSTMSGITATLSTTTPGVVITQPYSKYSNIPANGAGANTDPFQISLLPSFTCGTVITLQLTFNSSLGLFYMNYFLPSGKIATVPSRYDVTGNLAIPDVGTVDSTNVVSGFSATPLDKVVVSLYITHPFDSDLTNISLISPDGTTVVLSSANGGGGQNYGSGLADASRTTFDDAAGTSITNGTAPFAGTYRPQSPLAAFIDNTPVPNGNWHLHIADGFGGSLGTLRGWSLFLYGNTCTSGSGVCDTCMPVITNAINLTNLVTANRLAPSGEIASCGIPKPFPGAIPGAYHYSLSTFTNASPSAACVSVLLTSSCDLQAGIYLNYFDTNNLATNYLGDSGDYTTDGPQSCSVTVPAGATFVVEVNELTSGIGCSGYTLQLSGLPCPPPTLNIQPVSTNQARIYWDTSAGGYLLQSVSNLNATAWGAVTNDPIVNGNTYNVTNSTTTPAAYRFYRLQQP